MLQTNLKLVKLIAESLKCFLKKPVVFQVSRGRLQQAVSITVLPGFSQPRAPDHSHGPDL